MKISLIAAALPLCSLCACVVVPVGPDGRPLTHYGASQPVPAVAVVPAAPQPIALGARLYPVNTQAQAAGVSAGTVQNFLDGKGSFAISIAGEQFNGEATRASRGGAAGVANAVGNRGSSLSCTYAMNTPTQGTGRCSLSTGGEFQLHLGQ